MLTLNLAVYEIVQTRFHISILYKIQILIVWINMHISIWKLKSRWTEVYI